MTTDPQLEKIYLLEKVWHKSYDRAKAIEESISKADIVKYWLKVQLAYRIQREIRDKIDAMIDQYVIENIDKIIKDNT